MIARARQLLAEAPPRVVRCAIYTRKSTEDGLQQEFNSLDAQRESAEAYIASQKGQGWVCLPDRYDDGGYTPKGGKRYRYYVCANAQKRGWDSCPMPSVPAGEIERFVVDQIRRVGIVGNRKTVGLFPSDLSAGPAVLLGTV